MYWMMSQLVWLPMAVSSVLSTCGCLGFGLKCVNAGVANRTKCSQNVFENPKRRSSRDSTQCSMHVCVFPSPNVNVCDPVKPAKIWGLAVKYNTLGFVEV